jgi:hypothetical protein
MSDKEIRMCDTCKVSPGMWHLRAKTLFLCNTCKNKLEWEQANA